MEIEKNSEWMFHRFSHTNSSVYITHKPCQKILGSVSVIDPLHKRIKLKCEACNKHINIRQRRLETIIKIFALANIDI